MAYKSIRIAKEMIKFAKTEDQVLTPMQLIKLVYLSHAWMLALCRKPLIEEVVEAWKYGPVIPELYQEIKKYRDKPVEEIECENTELDADANDIIKQVYEKYGNLNGITLSMITHEKNSPWDKSWKNGNSIISNDLITYYYQGLVANG